MKAKLIKDILKDILEGNDFNEINKIINLEKKWKNIVGPTIFQNTEIIKIKNGILTLKTSTPIWRNELSLQKQGLLAKINEIKLEPPIKEIIFK